MLCKFSLSLLLIIPSLLSYSLLWIIENEFYTSHISLFRTIFILLIELSLFKAIEGVLLDKRSNNVSLLALKSENL